jgi:hypothetical protein
MMAVRKATRSNPPTQPQPQQAKTVPQPRNHQLRAEIFEALRNLNRGYGVSLAALDRLELKDRFHKPQAFPAGFLRGYRSRIEVLSAQTNCDLLRLIAEREEQEAGRFSTLAELKPKRHS